MKKISFLMILCLLYIVNVKGQETEEKKEFKPNGKAFGKVFWNYHYDATEGADQKNTFEIQRSYLGYKYNIAKNISTKITLDVGKNDAGSEHTIFLKTAQLDWKVAKKVKVTLGLMGLKQHKTQETQWGYRYISKTAQDEFGLSTSADLGINTEFKLSKMLKANFFVLNGEGYKKLQDNMGRMKVGGNIELTPVDGLTLFAHYDNYSGNYEKIDPDTDEVIGITDTSSIQSLAFFIGYKTEKFRIGAEYNTQLDGKKYASQAADHNLTSIAAYATFVINKQFEVFGKYMSLASNKLDGTTENWNYNKDGAWILGGVQYTPVNNFKVAANYRTFIYDKSDSKNKSMIYLNFEYSF